MFPLQRRTPASCFFLGLVQWPTRKKTMKCPCAWSLQQNVSENDTAAIAARCPEHVNAPHSAWCFQVAVGRSLLRVFCTRQWTQWADGMYISAADGVKTKLTLSPASVKHYLRFSAQRTLQKKHKTTRVRVTSWTLFLHYEFSLNVCFLCVWNCNYLCFLCAELPLPTSVSVFFGLVGFWKIFFLKICETRTTTVLKITCFACSVFLPSHPLPRSFFPSSDNGKDVQVVSWRLSNKLWICCLQTAHQPLQVVPLQSATPWTPLCASGKRYCRAPQFSPLQQLCLYHFPSQNLAVSALYQLAAVFIHNWPNNNRNEDASFAVEKLSSQAE